MVMALIEGETLNKKLMRERKLTPEAVERRQKVQAEAEARASRPART
jgi:hypothetical protein